MNKGLLTAALAGLVAASVSFSAQAEDKPAAAEKEKCYGIAKAGKNDCKAADGAHACAGHATADNNPNDFAFAAKGECAKLGGSLEAGKKADKK